MEDKGNVDPAVAGDSKPPAPVLEAVNKIGLEAHHLCALRKIIYHIYIEEKRIPSLRKLLIAAREQVNFKGSKKLLRKVLKAKLGFKFKECKNNGPVPMERHKTALSRINYLGQIQQNDALGLNKRPVVYIGEIKIQCNWQEGKQQSPIGTANASGKSETWILIHAGGETGFLEGVHHLSKYKPRKDWESFMKQNKFMKWLQEIFIPKLPVNAMVIVDNAPHHNKPKEVIPDQLSPKSALISWLQKHNIPLEDDMMRPELLNLIKKNKPLNNYLVDHLIEEAGCSTLRLPNYSDLNVLENILALIKGKVEDVYVQSISQFKEVVFNAINSITAQDWASEIKYVKQLESEYFKNEHQMDNVTDNLNLSFESSELEFSSDDDYSTDFSSSEDDEEDDDYDESDSSYLSIDGSYETDESDHNLNVRQL